MNLDIPASCCVCGGSARRWEPRVVRTPFGLVEQERVLVGYCDRHTVVTTGMGTVTIHVTD